MLKTNKNLILNIVKKILVCFDEKIKSNQIKYMLQRNKFIT